EIVLVDEGSRDNAARLINRVTRGDPRAAILQPCRGFGHLPADSAGLGDASSRAVMLMDSHLRDRATRSYRDYLRLPPWPGPQALRAILA
ncbi:MAG TPA: glycosyltransferase, partial [Isosphaeraceae bacterium]|nr:glycosyltransferase [Isosphaeraceae bacterium]